MKTTRYFITCSRFADLLITPLAGLPGRSLRPWLLTPIAALLFITLYKSMEAKTFYIDPKIGSISNDGSMENPWNTLKDVFDSNKIETLKYESKPAVSQAPMVLKNQGAPVKPGDTLVLRDGYHGEIYACEYYNDEYITIMAQQGHQPKIASMELRSGSKWIVKGLTISPSFAEPYRKKTLIQFSSHNWTGPSRDCIAEACTAYSVLDASVWTMQQWDTLSCDGMWLPGNKITARSLYFKNVNFGISVSGDSCLVERNTIENFAGDGLRGLGDFCTFQYNVVQNCYDVNANHDDGFQSWSVGDSGVGTGVVYGVVLRGNTIINYEDPNQPFLGPLQGIGCFDGMFQDWLVVNNVIMTDHWHGITLSGATNCVIINNTVVDLNTVDPGPPWIRIGDHKNGTPSTGCIVRNNLTTSLNITGQNVFSDHNIIIKNYDDFFVNYAAGDLHLKNGCAAIDSGSAYLAPSTDRDGVFRPQGSGIDVGAYEYQANKIITNKGIDGVLDFSYSFDGKKASFSFIRPECFYLCIFNVRGQSVFLLKGSNQKKATWNTDKIKNGTYFVRLVFKDRRISDKIVVVR